MIATQEPPAATGSPATEIELAPVPSAERETLLPPSAVMNKLATIAQSVAVAGLFGIRKPEVAFAKLLLGWEHGLGPMTALAEIYVDDHGKPALNARTMSAIVRNRGIGRIEVITAEPTVCKVAVTRTDWRAGKVEWVEFTADDACAGGKMRRNGDGTYAAAKTGSNYAKDPAAMMQARAISRAARRYFPEIFLGLPYTREDLDDDGGSGELSVEFTEVKPPWEADVSGVSNQADAATEKTPSPAPTPPAPVTQQPADSPPEAIDSPTASADQLSEAKNLVGILKLSAGDWAGLMARLGVKSLRDLSCPDAQRVIRFLDQLRLISILRKSANMPDEAWSRTLEKRGVTQAIDLPFEEAETIFAKLADRFTPFELKELTKGSPEVGPTAGKACASTPPAPAS